MYLKKTTDTSTTLAECMFDIVYMDSLQDFITLLLL